MNIVLNAPIMAWYYQVVLNKSYAFSSCPGFLKNLALFPPGVCASDSVPDGDDPLAYRMHLVYDAGDQLHLKKRQAILLGVLFLFAAGCVGYFVYDYNNNDQASRLSTEEKVEVNTALTGDARAQGLIESDQIIVLKRSLNSSGGTPRWNSGLRDLPGHRRPGQSLGYRTADVKGDWHPDPDCHRLRRSGAGPGREITGLTVTPEKD